MKMSLVWTVEVMCQMQERKTNGRKPLQSSLRCPEYTPKADCTNNRLSQRQDLQQALFIPKPEELGYLYEELSLGGDRMPLGRQ